MTFVEWIVIGLPAAGLLAMAILLWDMRRVERGRKQFLKEIAEEERRMAIEAVRQAAAHQPRPHVRAGVKRPTRDTTPSYETSYGSSTHDDYPHPHTRTGASFAGAGGLFGGAGASASWSRGDDCSSSSSSSDSGSSCSGSSE